jgi:spore maturation protein CgeB
MRKKIVQIESVYPEFADRLANGSSNFKGYTYSEILRIIFDSGWSSGQNVCPYMSPADWETHYVIPNFPPLQYAWLRENRLSLETPMHEVILAQLRAISPDVIYVSDLHSVNLDCLAQMVPKPLIVGWCATRPHPNIRWDRIDLLLSGIGKIREEALKLGAKSSRNFMSGAPSYRSLQHATKPLSSGLCFSGSFSPKLHKQRAVNFVNLAFRAPDLSINIFTADAFQLPDGVNNIAFFPPVYASDVVSCYAQHKIVLDGRADFGIGELEYSRETSNMRIFEATKAGSMLLTEYAENLQEYFRVGQEIETYSCIDELTEKAKFYSDARNESKRKKIALAGSARTLRCHLVEHRAAWFEGILIEELFS